MAKVVAGDAEAGGGSSWPSVLELEALMGERDMAALEALVKAKGGSGGVAVGRRASFRRPGAE